jgi:type II secretory pathway predicted ATPase ExeA
MYHGHFGLNKAPFRITPDTRQFFGGAQRAAVLETLKYAITSGEGIVKVTGEVGTGKTMLCRMLEEQLPNSVEIVYLANPSLNRDETLTAICKEIGLEMPPNTSHFDRQQALQNYLLKTHQQQRKVVVFIEEAQQMPLETLEEIRLLSNLETREAKLLQLVLFGQPELNQILEKHEIRQLSDRITHSFELTPLTQAEVRDYVRFRLHSAGNKGSDLFTAPAYWQLAAASGGLIRRLHVLADKALMSAYAAGTSRVRRHHVRRARNDGRKGSSGRKWVPPGLAPGLAAGMLVAGLIGFFFGATPADSDEQPARHTSIDRQIIDSLSRNKAVLLSASSDDMPLVSERISASTSWLDRPGDGHLTIQLMLTDNDNLHGVEKLLKTNNYRDLLPDIYLYRSDVGGRPRWNLLYGEFDDKTRALAALSALPERIRQHRPYVRSLRSLRSARQSAGAANTEG